MIPNFDQKPSDQKDQSPLITLKNPINEKSKMSGHPPAKKVGNQRIPTSKNAPISSNRSRNASKSGDSGTCSDNFAPLANLGGLGGFPTILMSEGEKTVIELNKKDLQSGGKNNNAGLGYKMLSGQEVKVVRDPKIQAGCKPVVRNINQPR